jgi:protein-disulfide isomerase
MSQKEMSVAAERRGKGGQGQQKLFFIALGLVVVAGIAWLLWATMGNRGIATEPVMLEGIEDPQALIDRAQGVGLGNPEAPVRILEFADYQCPACREFGLRSKPLLEEQFIRDGTAYLVYYDFVLGSFPHSFLLARAARCAGEQERFWEYQAMIYAEQGRLAQRQNVISDLIGFARELQLDGNAFESCLRSDRYADVVTANRILGERLGVNATPTVIVNGRRLRNPMDYNELRTVVQSEVEALRQRGAGE